MKRTSVRDIALYVVLSNSLIRDDLLAFYALLEWIAMEQMHLNRFDSDIYFVQIFRFAFDTKLLWFENVTITYRPTYVVVYKSKNPVSILHLANYWWNI